jgi:chromosome segregation ATPase
MIKKLIAIAVVGVVGAYIVGETKAGSHIRAWAGRMSTKLEKSVTPEMELARIKSEIGHLDGDVDKVKGDLAEANVNARLLRRETEEMRSEVKKSEAEVRKHGEVIAAASDNSQIQWGMRKVSYVDAKELLMAEVKRHNDLAARLKTNEQALTVEEQTRDLVEQQLQEMLRQKSELSSAVLQMEADIKLANVEQIRSKYQNDGTRMSDIKSSLAELRRRVMVQREKLHVAETYTKSPAAEKSVKEILGGLDNPDADSGNTGGEVKLIEKSK